MELEMFWYCIFFPLILNVYMFSLTIMKICFSITKCLLCFYSLVLIISVVFGWQVTSINLFEEENVKDASLRRRAVDSEKEAGKRPNPVPSSHNEKTKMEAGKRKSTIPLTKEQKDKKDAYLKAYRSMQTEKGLQE